jgi:hypothetical protein
VVYEVDDEKEEVREIEEENAHHSDPPRQVVEIN